MNEETTVSRGQRDSEFWGALLFGVGLAAGAGLVYLFNAQMGRLFSASDFGTFGALLAVLLALSGPTTALWGGSAMSSARSRTMPRMPWRMPILVAGAVGGLIGLLPFPEATRAAGWFGLAIAAWALLAWGRGLLIGFGRLGLAGATSVFDGLARLSLAMWLISRGWGIGGGAAGLALGLTATTVVTYALLPRDRSRTDEPVEPEVWAAVVGLFFVTAAQFADVVAVRVVSAGDAGAYMAASSLARVALYASGPAAAYALRRTAVVGSRRAFRRSVLLAVAPSALACGVLLLAPGWLLSLTYDGRYTQAAGLLRLLAVAMLMAGWALVAISALMGAGRSGWTAPLISLSIVGIVVVFVAADSPEGAAVAMVAIEAATLALSSLFLANLLSHGPESERGVLFMNWRDVRHPQGGGSEVFVEEVARRLAAQGRPVTVFCAAHQEAPASEVVDGVRFVRKGTWRTVYVWGAFAHAMGKLGPHGVVIDVQNAVPFLAPLYCSSRVVALVHHLHREQWRMMFSRRTARAGWWMESRFAPRVYRRSDYVAVSEATKQDLIDLGVTPERIAVVHNGTTPPNGASVGPRDPVPTIVYLGRLVPHKRVELLFDALAQLTSDVPDVRIRVVGRGPWEERLRAYAADAGVSNAVDFEGFLSETERTRVLSGAWVLGLPSIKEGWGLAVMEAAAVGTPAVAFGVGGLRESIRHGQTGLLAQTFGEFVDGLRSVLVSAPLRDRLGRAAKEHAARFTWEAAAAALTSIIDRPSGARPTAKDVDVVGDGREPPPMEAGGSRPVYGLTEP